MRSNCHFLTQPTSVFLFISHSDEDASAGGPVVDGVRIGWLRAIFGCFWSRCKLRNLRNNLRKQLGLLELKWLPVCCD